MARFVVNYLIINNESSLTFGKTPQIVSAELAFKYSLSFGAYQKFIYHDSLHGSCSYGGVLHNRDTNDENVSHEFVDTERRMEHVLLLLLL